MGCPGFVWIEFVFVVNFAEVFFAIYNRAKFCYSLIFVGIVEIWSDADKLIVSFYVFVYHYCKSV